MKVRALSIPFAALPLASLIGVSVCCAGPAASEGPLVASQPRTTGFTGTLVQSAFRARNSAPPARPKLDLRIPDNVKPAQVDPSDGPGAGNQNAHAFQLPYEKPKSAAEEFVNRVHHEGLPLARLWENKSALVSLGLNQKGQAGLWLLQKSP